LRALINDEEQLLRDAGREMGFDNVVPIGETR
jgi:hypothetical protein